MRLLIHIGWLVLLLSGCRLGEPLYAQTLIPTPTPMPSTPAQSALFHFPIVEDAEISGYFDHDPAVQSIAFYDGRVSSVNRGFAFSCPAVGGAWIGCTANVAGEAACANEDELWYDNHYGIDFEYSPNWHTGDSCDLARFGNISPLISAPAAGVVDFVGEDDPYNGNYIRLYHDLDGDGNYYNDGLRSYYLHFADDGILVDEGTIIAQGDPLGYGGATGLAWTPHLHFEVQQRTDIGWVAVDPFGWAADSTDPWYVPSEPLWNVATGGF